jgi:hypothetical protein
MEPDDKEPKRGTLHSFFRSSFKKKKLDITTSYIDESSQIQESDTIACCSTNKPLKSVSPSVPIPSSSPISSTTTTTSLSPSTATSPRSPPTFVPSSSSASPCSSSTSPPSARLAAANIGLVPSDISHSSKELPSQPKLASYKTNKDDRSFHSEWYSMFPWLEYSIQQDCAFCYYCRHFNDISNFLNRVCQILLLLKQI